MVSLNVIISCKSAVLSGIYDQNTGWTLLKTFTSELTDGHGKIFFVYAVLGQLASNGVMLAATTLR